MEDSNIMTVRVPEMAPAAAEMRTTMRSIKRDACIASIKGFFRVPGQIASGGQSTGGGSCSCSSRRGGGSCDVHRERTRSAGRAKRKRPRTHRFAGRPPVALTASRDSRQRWSFVAVSDSPQGGVSSQKKRFPRTDVSKNVFWNPLFADDAAS